ncbi:urea transporter [Nocardioides sp. cx-169]|uniref:urea transporter n=1 Tax=Nocardioides sp. cx-169 TaxID=2899080 RepID=UPI0035A98224
MWSSACSGSTALIGAAAFTALGDQGWSCPATVAGGLARARARRNLRDHQRGLSGYSGVLTAIALSVVFLTSSTYPWVYILTTWVLLVVAAFVPALRRP